MVLFAIAEMALEAGYMTIKTTYNLGYWLLYGKQKTETEILIEKQTNEIQSLHEDLVIITKRLEELETIKNHD